MQYDNEDYFSDGMIVPDKNYLGYLLEKSMIMNQIDDKNFIKEKLDLIYEEYNKLCELLKCVMELEQLDTFKRAGCFLVAINKFCLEKLDENVIIDAALLMCEHPYCFIGENNIVYKMNTVDLYDLFLNNKDLFVDKVEFINNIKLGRVNCLEISDKLELWYYIASIKNGLISRNRIECNLILKK